MPSDTGGQVPNCVAVDTLLDEIGTAELVHGDKRYDTNPCARKSKRTGGVQHSAQGHGRLEHCFSPHLYKSRNAIERMFNRRKGFRRIATRYDRLAINFHAAVYIGATISYWF